MFLQIASQVALARILGPEQYGLFAIGAIVVSFSGFFSDFGIAYGLIQKSEVSNDDLRFVATWQLLTGTLVTLLIVFASGAIALFLGDARAEPVIAALAVVCLLNALAAPSLNLLKRNLDFRWIQLTQITAYVIGFIFIGIPMALMGMAAWALVAAWLAQASIMLLMMYAHSRHAVRPLLWFSGAAGMLRYGGTVLITNLVNWVIGNIDKVVIARSFTSREVGLYSTSYNMMYNPTSSLLGVIQPVFFSASSRIADDRGRIGNAYVALIGCLALFILPVFAGLAVVAHTFVLALYGPAWRDAGAVMMPIALAMPFFLAWGLTTPLVWAGGAPGSEWRVQLPLAVIWLLATMWAAQYSAAAVGWSVAFLALLRFLLMLRVALKLLQLEAGSIWRAARGGLFLATICAMALAGVDALLTSHTGLNAAFRLSIEALTGAIVMAGLLFLVPGLLVSEAVAIVEKVMTRLPLPMQGPLKRLLLRRST